MLLRRNNKGQSMLEYTILLAVIVAALLVTQGLVKRGVQGGQKEAADKLGDGFSVGGTTISQERKMLSPQTITEEVATTITGEGISHYVTGDLQGTLEQGVYSLNSRDGGDSTTEVKQQTESVKLEKVRWDEYQETQYDDFPDPF